MGVIPHLVDLVLFLIIFGFIFGPAKCVPKSYCSCSSSWHNVTQLRNLESLL